MDLVRRIVYRPRSAVVFWLLFELVGRAERSPSTNTQTAGSNVWQPAESKSGTIKKTRVSGSFFL